MADASLPLGDGITGAQDLFISAVGNAGLSS